MNGRSCLNGMIASNNVGIKLLLPPLFNRELMLYAGVVLRYSVCMRNVDPTKLSSILMLYVCFLLIKIFHFYSTILRYRSIHRCKKKNNIRLECHFYLEPNIYRRHLHLANFHRGHGPKMSRKSFHSRGYFLFGCWHRNKCRSMADYRHFYPIEQLREIWFFLYARNALKRSSKQRVNIDGKNVVGRRHLPISMFHWHSIWDTKFWMFLR